MYYDPEMTLQESETSMVWDPVCGMSFDARDAVGTSQYEGRTYYFCSPGCKEEFDEFPEEFAESA